MKLGQKIVAELGLNHTNKLLSRWMAHRVAELMQKAEAAAPGEEREAACRECEDLILRLWQRRMEWPHGAPLSHILPELRKLTAELANGHQWSGEDTQTDGTWVSLLNVLDTFNLREIRVCLAAAYADFSSEAAEHSREWLEEQPDDLSEDERETLTFHKTWIDRVASDDFTLDGKKIPKFSALPPDKRTALVKKALGQISVERQKLITQTESFNGKMQTLEPNRMRGNLSADEESHGDYFAELYDEIKVIYGNEEDDE